MSEIKTTKGRANRLDLNFPKEYEAGMLAPARSTNPYDFFDEYEKHYAWCIGNQKGNKDEN